MKRALTLCLALPLLLAAVPRSGHAQAAAAPPAGAPAAGQATPAANAPMFSDVPKDHWAYQSVAKLYKLGILRGEGGTPRVNKKTGPTKAVKKATS